MYEAVGTMLVFLVMAFGIMDTIIWHDIWKSEKRRRR